MLVRISVYEAPTCRAGRGLLRPLDAVQELGCGDGCDRDWSIAEGGQDGWHIELVTLRSDEDGGIEDSSHRGEGSGKRLRSFARSASQTAASAAERCGRRDQRWASSAAGIPFGATGEMCATATPSRSRVA